MKKRAFISQGNFCVYILQCLDGSYYTGHTNNLERRLKQHTSGKGGALYTKWKGAQKLVWTKKCRDFNVAFSLERSIKKLTRSQKEALVAGKRLSTVFKKVKKVTKHNKRKGRARRSRRVNIANTKNHAVRQV